ncbi:MAG: hypothetical protein ACI8RZ_001535 [Myxococcota bacterium]
MFFWYTMRPMRRITIPALLSALALTGCGDKTVDFDGDGFPEAVDCDDNDVGVYPGSEEVCDEVDNDCDGETDEDATDGTAWFYDGDGDGYGSATYPTTSTCDFTAPSGYVDNNDDCNDGSAASLPGGIEVCDGEDNNCNDSVDDFALDTSLWYFDGDGDGYGDPATSQQLCDPPSGWVDNGTDCDDSDASLNPGQEWYIDADQDGFGNPDYRLAACGEQIGFAANNTDCDDGDAVINPGVDEVCDGVDNNCDEEIDEETATDATSWYDDSDEDGYGEDATLLIRCDQPESTVDLGGDCDDGDDEINPGVPDWCGDGVDGNCDGDVDTRCAISAADADIRVKGENLYDYLGTSLSAGGDFNGDGAVDVLIGADYNDDNGTSSGKAYLLLGPIDAGEYDAGDAQMTITGSATSDYLGYRLALGGDVDSDGYDELLVNAYSADLDTSTTNTGSVYVFYGPTTGDFEADEADSTIMGVSANDYTGKHQLGALADFNGDGEDDVHVGSANYDSSYTYAGILAVFYGPVSGDLDLDDSDIQITGSAASRYVGYASAFTDFDGDGNLDVLFSEPNANTVYGLLGPISGSLTASDAALSIASTDSDFTGGQLKSGDFDNDGYADILVGAYLDDSYLENAGQVSVLYGPVSGSMTMSSATFSVHGQETNNYLGRPIYDITVGDLDGDGSDDLFIGEPGSDLYAENAGIGYLFYGPVSGTGQPALTGADRLIIGETSSDTLGWGSNFADIDNDGTTDLLFTARAADSYYGVGYAIFGENL